LAGALAIVFAYNGYGVYALVIQQIVASLIKTALLWKISVWYPRLEFSWAEVKRLTGFSFYVFAAQSMNQFIRQADTLIVGKLFSAATLGFYTRANSLNSLIYKNSVNSITKVFFPVLSTIQDDVERFKKVYLRLINIISGISVFMTGILFLSGEEIIIGLFGSKWEPSVLIFQILIIKGFTYPISAMIVNAFMAMGKSKENFHYGNIRKALHLVPLVVAYFWGYYEFLYALVGISILGWFLNNWFVTITLKISLWQQTKAVLPNLMVTILLITGISIVFPDERSYLLAIVKIMLFSSIFLLWLYLAKAVLLEEGLFYSKKVWQKLNQGSKKA